MCRRPEEGCPTVGIPSSCKHFVGFYKVPVQHRYWAILSVLPQLDPSLAKWDLNQPNRVKTITSSWNDNEWQTSLWEIRSWIRGRESRTSEEATYCSILQNLSGYLFNN